MSKMTVKQLLDVYFIARNEHNEAVVKSAEKDEQIPNYGGLLNNYFVIGDFLTNLKVEIEIPPKVLEVIVPIAMRKGL